MIDGETKLVGLIGWPVKHSISPILHNGAFDALSLNWRYLPLPVDPKLIDSALPGLAALGFRGVNVTAPYKQYALANSMDVSREASRIGAVNTIQFNQLNDGKVGISGSNTDMRGFLNALYQADFHPDNDQKAIIIGAGGAARAVICGLLDAGMGEIAIYNRTLEKSKTLIDDFRDGEATNQPKIFPLSLKELFDYANEADLLVNTTPVGTWPDIKVSVWPENMPIPSHIMVYDLVYNPSRTQLLNQATKAGARCIGGLEMLIHQAALAFELWVGEPAPIEVMRSFGTAALTRNS